MPPKDGYDCSSFHLGTLPLVEEEDLATFLCQPFREAGMHPTQSSPTSMRYAKSCHPPLSNGEIDVSWFLGRSIGMSTAGSSFDNGSVLISYVQHGHIICWLPYDNIIYRSRA